MLLSTPTDGGPCMATPPSPSPERTQIVAGASGSMAMSVIPRSGRASLMTHLSSIERHRSRVHWRLPRRVAPSEHVAVRDGIVTRAPAPTAMRSLLFLLAHRLERRTCSTPRFRLKCYAIFARTVLSPVQTVCKDNPMHMFRATHAAMTDSCLLQPSSDRES